VVTYNGRRDVHYQVDVIGSRMTFRVGGRVFKVWTVSPDVRTRTLFQTRDGGEPENNLYRLDGDELVTAWVGDRHKGRRPTLEPAPGVTVVVYRRVARP
jgi:hypothetical protein